MAKANETTKVWAVVGGELESAEVASVRRSSIVCAFGVAPSDERDFAAFFVEMSCPTEPKLAVSQDSSTGVLWSAALADVPADVLAAAVAWWAEWAGRDCAREWHEQEPGEVPRGWDYRRWAAEQGGLPAQGDVDFFERGMRSLAGRDPTDAEREAFGDALLSRLWDLTPLAKADDDGAAA